MLQAGLSELMRNAAISSLIGCIVFYCIGIGTVTRVCMPTGYLG